VHQDTRRLLVRVAPVLQFQFFHDYK
jgi:hypothetical protein